MRLLPLLVLLLLAGCEDPSQDMIRYCEENGIPYRVGETRSDRAGRFITLHAKGYDRNDAELAEYLKLDAELRPTAARAKSIRSRSQP